MRAALVVDEREHFDRLEEFLTEIDALLDKIRQLDPGDVPDTVEALRREGWEWLAEAIDLHAFNVDARYLESEALTDSRRIISLRSVEDILIDYEAQLLVELVESPTTAAFAPFRAIWQNLDSIGRGLRFFFTRAFTGRGSIVSIVVNLCIMISATVTLFSLPTMLARRFISRDFYVAQLRKRAFPQSNGPRYRRRKLHRL